MDCSRFYKLIQIQTSSDVDIDLQQLCARQQREGGIRARGIRARGIRARVGPHVGLAESMGMSDHTL